MNCTVQMRNVYNHGECKAPRRNAYKNPKSQQFCHPITPESEAPVEVLKLLRGIKFSEAKESTL